MTGAMRARKKAVVCNQDPMQVHDPKTLHLHPETESARREKTEGFCCCARSISSPADMVQENTRSVQKPEASSPVSVASNIMINPIDHKVVFNNSRLELMIRDGHDAIEGGDFAFVGSLHLGTPGPRGYSMRHLQNAEASSAAISRSSSAFELSSVQRSPVAFQPLVCQKCSEHVKNLEVLEEHHIIKHAVTELDEGSSSRDVIEKICKTSMSDSESNGMKIERVLKVHNTLTRLAEFEEYRETVKIKGSKNPDKHPRLQADGYELLRFYGAAVACSLGSNRSSSLCSLHQCALCRILQDGLPKNHGHNNGSTGVLTASTSRMALESMQVNYGNKSLKKALLICRVIAGRFIKSVEEDHQELLNWSSFDSLARNIGRGSGTEALDMLYLRSRRAILPCFVVICKT